MFFTLSVLCIGVSLWFFTLCITKAQQLSHVNRRCSFDPGESSDHSQLAFFLLFFCVKRIVFDLKGNIKTHCWNPLDPTHTKFYTETNPGYLLKRFPLAELTESTSSILQLSVSPYITKQNVQLCNSHQNKMPNHPFSLLEKNWGLKRFYSCFRSFIHQHSKSMSSDKYPDRW